MSAPTRSAATRRARRPRHRRPAPPGPLAPSASPAAAAAGPAPAITDAPPPRGWYRDPLGGALALTGVVGAGLGAFALHTADADAARARAPGLTYGQYADLAQAARGDRALAVAAWSAGAIALGLAAWRYRSVAVAAAPRDGGVVIAAALRF